MEARHASKLTRVPPATHVTAVRGQQKPLGQKCEARTKLEPPGLAGGRATHPRELGCWWGATAHPLTPAFIPSSPKRLHRVLAASLGGPG